MNGNIDSQSMLRVGTILHGTYRIERYLSSGGFGNTYVVVHTEFNEFYAIKEFFMKGITQRDGDSITVSVSNAANQSQFAEQKEKFKKEARRLRGLSNPHVVKVYDLFEENGTVYYVMDFINGESLSERLKRLGAPLSEAEVNKYLSQILDALECVHGQQIWHLDLKPANIMVDKSGAIKLIDFGASKQIRPDGGATTSTALCYTPGYAPNEQTEQSIEKFGPWTDFYALGATLYKLLTNNEPPKPSDISDYGEDAFHFTKSVSTSMRGLILWMMNPNRKQRPQNVEEIQKKISGDDDVTVSASDRPVHADTPTENHLAEETVTAEEHKAPAPKVEKPVRRQRRRNDSAKVLVSALIAFAALFGIVVFGISNNHHKHSSASVETVDSADVKTVADTQMSDSLNGDYQYSGPVDSSELPHGNGIAYYVDGRVYKGPFVHGVRQGDNAWFKFSDGNVYEGSFVNDEFGTGTLTSHQSDSKGMYFQGTFKNNQPYSGNWYDETGHLYAHVKEGK
jgi:serine/threonine protein kinase